MNDFGAFAWRWELKQVDNNGLKGNYSYWYISETPWQLSRSEIETRIY